MSKNEPKPEPAENPLAEISIESPPSSIPDHTRPAGAGKRKPKESAAPEDRSVVGRSARERQLRPLSPPQPVKFEVRYQEKTATVEAIDENEAWAKFCDAEKVYPSPAGRIVRRLDAAAA